MAEEKLKIKEYIKGAGKVPVRSSSSHQIFGGRNFMHAQGVKKQALKKFKLVATPAQSAQLEELLGAAPPQPAVAAVPIADAGAAADGAIVAAPAQAQDVEALVPAGDDGERPQRRSRWKEPIERAYTRTLHRFPDLLFT